MTRRTTILLALLTGIALEVAVSRIRGRREAWDSTLYWTAGVPAALVVAVAIGYLARGADWVWAILIVPGQFVAMAARSRDFSLLPLGLILGAVMGLPFLVAAFVGQKLKRR